MIWQRTSEATQELSWPKENEEPHQHQILDSWKGFILLYHRGSDDIILWNPAHCYQNTTTMNTNSWIMVHNLLNIAFIVCRKRQFFLFVENKIRVLNIDAFLCLLYIDVSRAKKFTLIDVNSLCSNNRSNRYMVIKYL